MRWSTFLLLLFIASPNFSTGVSAEETPDLLENPTAKEETVHREPIQIDGKYFGDPPILSESTSDQSSMKVTDGDDFDDDFSDDFDDDFEAEEEDLLVVKDPFEPLNRVSFWFNDRLYVFVLKPVVTVYRVVPEPARISISNFLSNLATPVRFVNSLIQLKIKDAGNELSRFVINSTVGIGGLFDPATTWAGVESTHEDFGQTLGHYGAGPGNYTVWPVLGPSTTRDGIGAIVDFFLDPITYIFLPGQLLEYLSVKGVDVVNTVSLDKDTYDTIKKQALDPYLFIRNAYIQKRQGVVEK